MAKAKKKRTDDDEFTPGELTAAVDQLAGSELAKEMSTWISRAAADQAMMQKARKAIDRALSIQDGIIPPPWAEKLLKLLRPRASRPTGAGIWIAAEVERMKAAGTIPADIRITHLARTLAKRMRAAAAHDDSLKPVGEHYIKNHLPIWGLWPIS